MIDKHQEDKHTPTQHNAKVQHCHVQSTKPLNVLHDVVLNTDLYAESMSACYNIHIMKDGLEWGIVAGIGMEPEAPCPQWIDNQSMHLSNMSVDVGK